MLIRREEDAKICLLTEKVRFWREEGKVWGKSVDRKMFRFVNTEKAAIEINSI